MRPGCAALGLPRLPAPPKKPGPAWPTTELELGVIKLAEHVCSFVETWRSVPGRLEGASLHEVQLIVFRLTRQCTNKLQKVGPSCS
jgi:hypothetical protein